MKFDILDYHVKMDVDKVILYYKGPFDEDILVGLNRYIRSEFESAPQIGSQIVSIFMELAQNIARYSEEHNFFYGTNTKGVGTIVITRSEEQITLVAGNAIKKEHVQELSKKCSEINELNYEELRALRRKIRNQPRKGEDDNSGNIGLIQVALKSGSPLNISYKPIDSDLSFYLMSVDVEVPATPVKS